jgi:WD40 repeat protein
MRALEQEDLDTIRTTEGLPAVYRKQSRDDEAEKLDGKLEASASEDGAVRLWDSATGPARGTLTGHSNAVNVESLFHHNGHLLMASIVVLQ